MLAEYLVDARLRGGAGRRRRGDARGARARGCPTLVLLDVGLPGEDGLTLARYLRERYDVGIIMVTGAGDVVDRVAGLEVGADDYIAKPFDPRELRARLKSVLRRGCRSARRRAQRGAAAARRHRPLRARPATRTSCATPRAGGADHGDGVRPAQAPSSTTRTRCCRATSC